MSDVQFFESIKTLKDQVGYILKKFPDTRNDDEILVRKTCEEFKLNAVALASSIERCRRHYNQNGEYLPTVWEVAKKRKIAEEVWREALGYRGLLI